jgi:2-dehydropantoate 2-reductase
LPARGTAGPGRRASHRGRCGRGTAATIAREGITLCDDTGTQHARVAAARAADVSGPADVVILMTKGMHSAAAIQSVAHLADGQCLALTLQNGLGNVEAIATVFAPDRILWGVTDFPADLDGPAQVSSHGAGHIWLGGADPVADVHALGVATLLDRNGLNAVVDPQVRAAVWEKVAFNAALNALATITGKPVGGLDCAEGRRIALAVVEETMATAQAHGVPSTARACSPRSSMPWPTIAATSLRCCKTAWPAVRRKSDRSTARSSPWPIKPACPCR